MITIQNTSPDETPEEGMNQYEVKINGALIASFDHYRRPNGLSDCLRDAAKAIDEQREKNNLKGAAQLFGYNID